MMDTTQTVIYPCEPATTEQLDEMLRKIVYRRKEADLKRFVCRAAPGEVRWERVRHLRITGNPRVAHTLEISAADGSLYFHTSADGSWLLIFAKTPLLKDYLKYCSGALESLWIHGIGISTLPGLENLTRLTALNLSGCEALTKLPGLGSLTWLTSLDLSGCRSLAKLPGLVSLTRLTSLDLSGCHSLTELLGLGSLTQLTSLNLSWCASLAKLPGLGSLTQLTYLNLSWCRSLTKLPGLGSLTRLTYLNLSDCLSFTELPGLGNLTQLTYLNLSDCHSLTELPGLGSLTQLTYLNLSWCVSLVKLPAELRDTKSLRNLDLQFLKLRTLPDWLPDIAERFSLEPFGTEEGKNKAVVYLCGTIVEDMPDMSIFEQPYEMVAAWFKARKQGSSQLLNEIKVVFLGDGEAGKSHTIARLMNNGGEPVDYVDQSTPGIVIKDRDYTVDGRTFRVHYWDFGGQEIMHSMHRIFLTGRTMYVVLLNARDDTQSDRAKYWLHNIQSFAPGAPVLLVLNKIDQNPKASVDERTLRARYSGLTQIIKLSARDFSQEDFNKTFTDVLLAEIKNTGYLDAEWPESWIRVKERLEKMDTHYILGDKYKKICRECQVNDLQTDLLHWFNDLGVSFCFCDKEDYTLKKHVILRPDWITNGLYIILFNECPGANNGRIPHEAIYDLLERASTDSSIQCTLPEASYDKIGDVEYVLGVMRKFQLSLDNKDGTEFIPMLCKQNSTIDIHYYEKDSDLLEFCMDFDYLPDNLLHRLMVNRPADLDMNNVWRTGARFTLPDTKLSAVVVIDGNTLRFFIRGDDPMHRPNTYLAILKADVDRIVNRMGLKPPACQLIYKLGNRREEFEFGLLMDMLDAGVPHIYSRIQRKMIPIADILKQSAPEELQKGTEAATGSITINIYEGDHVEGDKINGDQYNHVIPEALTAILDKLITENIQTQRDFADRLLSQLEASEDEAAREHFVDDLMPQLEASEDKTICEIAEDARTDSNKKRNILTALRKIVSGSGSAVSFLADAPEAVKTLAAITTAVTTVAAEYGPEIAEFITKLPPLPL